MMLYVPQNKIATGGEFNQLASSLRYSGELESRCRHRERKEKERERELELELELIYGRAHETVPAQGRAQLITARCTFKIV